MKRDMEIVRKVLLVIEEQYVDVALYDIKVDGLDMKTIAYHCKILYDGGLISDYKGDYGGDGLNSFGVGSLTWEGHEFLDKIRDNSIWDKTKKTIKSKGLPMVLDVVIDVSKAIVTEMTSSVASGIIKGVVS